MRSPALRPVIRNEYGRPYVAAATGRPGRVAISCTLISCDPIYCGQEEHFYDELEDSYDPPRAI